MKTRNLDTALLRSFIAVADTKSITAAAQHVHLTQAAISQQIRRLEQLTGGELFERHHNGVTLSPHGHRLLPLAMQMLALNEDIVSASLVGEFVGTLRLGAPYDLVGRYMPTILEEFADICPKGTIHLTCATSPDLHNLCRSGGLDLAIVEELVPQESAEILMHDQLVWIGRHKGHAATRRPLPVALGGDTCAFRPAIAHALRAADIPWSVASDVGNFDVMKALVYADVAVSAFLRSTAPGDLDCLDSQAGLPDLPPFSICLYAAPSRASPAASALASAVRKSFAP